MTKEEHAKVLAALEAITKHFSISRLHESTLADTTVRGQAHEAIAIMRKEPPRWTPEELAEAQKRADAYSDWFLSGAKPEPISDAEILSQAKDSGLTRYVNRHMVGAASWGGMEVNLLAFARALLEKAR